MKAEEYTVNDTWLRSVCTNGNLYYRLPPSAMEQFSFCIFW
jgi:hypothetical protein